MTYQIGPKPEGLHYQPIIFNTLKKPIWLLRDADGVVWVDIKSAVVAFGMSWKRWHMLIKHQRGIWKMEGCLDRNGLETELIRETNFTQWIDDIKRVVADYPAWVGTRVQSIRGAWRERFNTLAADQFPDHTAALASGRLGRKRKVTAEIVIRLHHELRVIGKSLGAAAKNLQIGEATARQIAAGTYKNWTRDAAEAWSNSFGA